MAPRDYTAMLWWSVGGLIALALLAVFQLRHRIAPFLPSRLRHLAEHRYTLLPTSADPNRQGGGTSFAHARAGGLTSRLFDIDVNISANDQRALDAQEVQRIMQDMDVGFDEARLIRQKRYLARNGVDASGMPTDKKAITSLS